MDRMPASDSPGEPVPPAGRLWFVRRLWPYARIVIVGYLPCPDLIARFRMRRAARGLITVRTWPDMAATSADVAQLAMLRLLDLQRQTRRAVRGRHREASVMLARASVETLLLGLYCHRETNAVGALHAGNLKALGDALAYLEEAGIVPESVIRDCVERLGVPAQRHISPWVLVDGIDKANGNKSARSLYRRLYIPLSNFTVHASGGTLLRHVRRNGRLSPRPSAAWNRRSPARVADAAAGILAADLAQHAEARTGALLKYSHRHEQRTLMPMAVMGLVGTGSSMKPGKILETARTAKTTFDYLWRGAAAADPLDVRTALVRKQFASVLDIGDLDIPAGALDPFIDYVADYFARLVPDARTAN
jgi:hypothetical protein